MSAEQSANVDGRASTTQGPTSKGEGDSEMVGNYKLEATIGSGTYGKVKLGRHVVTQEKVAIKVIEKAQIQSQKQVSRLQREIRFLKLLHHPHIVKVYDVIETNEYIYIIMEYAAGGELFDYIVAHKRVKEREARGFFRMVLSAVEYCHKNAVIHRDLKPENLLLDSKKHIKIIDFGFGNNFSVDGLLDTFCGSPFYAAPEMILGKKYEGPEVDMWSLGVILFALLCGHLPFDDENMKELYKKIASGNYSCPDYLLPNARHLIGRLITVDPKKRATLNEVLVHPWVIEGYGLPPPNYLPQRPIINNPAKLSKDITNRLKAFGYTDEAIFDAFRPEADFSKVNPIRATYFLLVEMLQREEARIREVRRKTGKRESVAKSDIFTKASQITLNPEATDAQEDLSTPAVKQTEESNTSTTAKASHETDGEEKPKLDITNFTSTQTLDDGDVRRDMSELPTFEDANRQQPVQRPPEVRTAAERHERVSHFISLGEQDVSSLSNALSRTTVQTNRDSSKDLFMSTVTLNEYATSGDLASQRLTIPRPSTGMAFHPHTQQQSEKDDLRSVSGWFLTVSTTSTKKPAAILSEVIRALKLCNIPYTHDGGFIILCEMDATSVNAAPTSNTVYGTSRTKIPAATANSSSHVCFQIEVCKIPRMNSFGVHFKRLSGGVWNYKKVCSKLLLLMQL